MNTDWIAKQTTEELSRRLRFHDNDRGCMTMEQEIRRMVLVDAIGAELQRRGIDPWAEAA